MIHLMAEWTTVPDVVSCIVERGVEDEGLG